MANSTILYACTERGLGIVNKPGTLPEWLPPKRVLVESSVVSAWAEPGPPIRVAVVADGALRVSANGGRSWDDVALGPAALVIWEGKVAGDERASLYAAQAGGGIVASRDGGATWSELPALPLDAIGVTYCGQSDGGDVLLLGRSSNGTSALLLGKPETGEWTTVLTGETSSAQVSSDGSLYACMAEGVLQSSNGGATWTALTGAPAGGKALAIILGAAGKPTAFLVGLADGLAVSRDGGETWTDASLPVEGSVTALTRDPERRDRIYAGLSTGYLLESGNRGEKWEPVNTQPLHAISGLYVIRI